MPSLSDQVKILAWLKGDTYLAEVGWYSWKNRSREESR